MKFVHINLVVANPEKSADFYRRFLIPDGAQIWLGDSLHLRNQSVDLAFQAGMPARSQGAHHGFLADSSHQIDRLADDLMNTAVQITDDCREADFRSIKFLDPDQYEIEVYWEADWPVA